MKAKCQSISDRIRASIERIQFGEGFTITIRRATENQAVAILEQIHEVEGPNGTHFWFDIDDGDDDGPIPPSEPVSPQENTPVIAG
ncbi:MAG: hypothetical protein AAB489_01190 [Patescibacteria group bacterium]